MPKAYFTVAKRPFHGNAISFVPNGTNFIEKAQHESIGLFLVEAKGFEPPVSWSQTRRDSQTSLRLAFVGRLPAQA